MNAAHVNLYLVGFMGTGKTTVGRAVAAKLGFRVLDSDHEIERLQGKTIPAIFAQSGEPAFRVMEREFIERTLRPLAARHAGLRVIFEHITTAAAVEFVQSAREGIAATITPQHLLYNRNEMFRGGIRPHFYCLPVLKTEPDRQALLEAATSGHRRFFLGTDSAPHERHTKEAACGCAGIYSAHAALELYAEAFERMGRLDRLEAFASLNGPDFYRLPRNTTTVTLRRTNWQVPQAYAFGSGTVVPMKGNGTRSSLPASITSTSYTSSRGIEFWFAVTPRLNALIAQSTAGQWSVVNRAPTPSVLRPSVSAAVGKIVLAGRCACTRFFNRSRFAKVAGNACVPSESSMPSCNASVRPCSRQAQSPLAPSSRVQAPAAVSNRLFGYTFSSLPERSWSLSDCQSRQKSGLTHGFDARRRLCSSRKRLMADMRTGENAGEVAQITPEETRLG